MPHDIAQWLYRVWSRNSQGVIACHMALCNGCIEFDPGIVRAFLHATWHCAMVLYRVWSRNSQGVLACHMTLCNGCIEFDPGIVRVFSHATWYHCANDPFFLQKIQRSTMTTNLFRRPTKEKSVFNFRGGAGARSRFGQQRASSVATGVPQSSAAKVSSMGAFRAPGSPRGRRQVFGAGAGAASLDRGSPTAAGKGGEAPTGALRGLTGTVDQLREGAELNQAQMRAMFDRMCALSAEVDNLKGQIKT